MALYDSTENVSLHSAFYRSALAFCWLLGLICGVALFLYAGTPVLPLMRGILSGSVSIVSLCVIGLIPFLFSAYAVYLSKLWLLLAICFCKACLLSFISIGITFAFGSAGWLMRALLLFSCNILCVLLYFLWTRLLLGRKPYWFAIFAIGIFACSVAFYIISPFLACLIDY